MLYNSVFLLQKLKDWLTCELELSANLANALALERSIRSRKNGKASLKKIKKYIDSLKYTQKTGKCVLGDCYLGPKKITLDLAVLQLLDFKHI